jgi:WD40 repeat protein
MQCGSLGLFLTLVLSAVIADTSSARQPPSKPPALPPINPAQARLDQTLGGLDGPGSALAYSEQTGILAAACEKGTIHYWQKGVTLGIRAGDRSPNVWQAHKGPITALARSNGPVFASAGVDQKIILWSLPDGQSWHTLPATGVVRALAMANDGKLLAAAGEPLIQLWDVTTGKPGTKLAAHNDWVTGLAFSTDGKLLASGGYDGLVRLWDVASGQKLLDIPSRPPTPPNTPAGVPNVVLSLAFSPDNKQLAVGGTDAQIHIVNPSDGKIVRSLAGHASSVTALAFHPGGSLLVSGSKDRTIRLWNPANGQPLKTLEGHAAWVQGVAFMAQGTRLASVGADQTVRLWDLR